MKKGKINRDVLLSCLEKHLNELFDIFILTKNVEVETRLQKQIDYISSILETIECHTAPGDLCCASFVLRSPPFPGCSVSVSDTE